MIAARFAGQVQHCAGVIEAKRLRRNYIGVRDKITRFLRDFPNPARPRRMSLGFIVPRILRNPRVAWMFRDHFQDASKLLRTPSGAIQKETYPESQVRARIVCMRQRARGLRKATGSYQDETRTSKVVRCLVAIAGAIS